MSELRVAVCAAEEPARAEVLALYAAVGWTAYTDSPEVLVRALDHTPPLRSFVRFG